MNVNSAHPNVLVVMTDQQRWDSLGCTGNVFVKTPSIDRLAREGARFANAFTPFPICTPARATAWTGVFPHVHAIVDCCYNIDSAFDEAEVSVLLFDMLKAQGYDTAYFGKWHLGEAAPLSIDVWEAFNSLGGHWVDGRQAFQGGVYKAEVQTDKLIAYLEGRAGSDRPFLAVQSYYPPHDPFSAPTAFYEPYRGKGVPFAGYYAAVSALDHYVGKTLDALRRLGLDRDTLVIFCSDHGETFLYRGGTDHKATCHDDSIRIPFLLWAPGRVPEGAVIEGAVGLQDIVPTVLDYAGAPLPPHVQGQSLRPIIEGRASGRSIQYIENTTDFRDEATISAMFDQRYNGRARPDPLRVEQRAIWTPDWKLVLDAGEQHLMFDLRIDPEEEYNLYGAPRVEAQDRYRHFADQGPTFLRLVRMLRAEAERLEDHFGVELADQVIARHAERAR
jgi:arylsulfatase A-like enzyme